MVGAGEVHTTVILDITVMDMVMVMVILIIIIIPIMFPIIEVDEIWTITERKREEERQMHLPEVRIADPKAPEG